MNGLITLTDSQLETRIAEVQERERSVMTQEGYGFLISKMRELIGLLQTWGYKADIDENSLATLWANSLRDEFVMLGVIGMKQAVMMWAQRDESPYRVFPKVAWIADACKELGGNPRAEKARREQEARELQLEKDHKKQMEHYAKTHPREWARIEAEAERCKNRKMQEAR
ncbi:MAG: hypothetical protein IJL97_03860 [Lachnospiraceae bacterium]|nr:hypothetical protein [Clostridia bacterium]MBR0085667.1 hypothetical protein [Lachnospiraceae bacterium]